MMNVGVIGCGNIAETYFRAQDYFNNINFIACSDINLEVAKKASIEHNVEALTIDEMLNSKNIDLILNLTIHKHTMRFRKSVFYQEKMSIPKNL